MREYCTCSQTALPSLEVESTDYVRPQLTVSNESDSQPCDSFRGGSYTRKGKQKIG